MCRPTRPGGLVRRGPRPSAEATVDSSQSQRPLRAALSDIASSQVLVAAMIQLHDRDERRERSRVIVVQRDHGSFGESIALAVAQDVTAGRSSVSSDTPRGLGSARAAAFGGSDR